MSREVRKEILGMSTITYKYQVTIPKKARDRFKLDEGDSVVFVDEDGKLVIVKSTEFK
jgi:AbrB family looped-hinge helix DNA binding protein